MSIIYNLIVIKKEIKNYGGEWSNVVHLLSNEGYIRSFGGDFNYKDNEVFVKYMELDNIIEFYKLSEAVVEIKKEDLIKSYNIKEKANLSEKKSLGVKEFKSMVSSFLVDIFDERMDGE